MDEKMIETIVSLAELQALPDEYRAEILADLPQDGNDCYVYSFLITPVLFYKMEDYGLDLSLLSNYLHELYEAEQYRAMHLYLVMCFKAVEVEVPPFFLEFSQDDELLAMLMYEILMEFEDFIEDDEVWEDDDIDE